MSQFPETAVVLAGGLAVFHGFALAPYPKILLPLANRPLLHYQARILAEVGVKRLVFCLNPGMGARVAEQLGSLPGSLEYQVRETSYGTGGSLKEVEDALQDRAFWVISGDLLPGASLVEMLAMHQQRRVAATLGVLQVREAPWEMERVEFDLEERVRTIHRIHPAQERRSTLRPAGLYLFESEVLEVIPPSSYFDLKEQLVAQLYQRGTPMWTWEMPRYSRTITCVGDFFSANLDVLNSRVLLPDQVNFQDAPNNSAQVQVSASAKVFSPTAIGSGSRIGDEVIILGPSVIGSNCEIESGAVINECVILDNARIGQQAHLHRCVVGDGAEVSGLTSVYEMAVMRSLSSSPEQAVCPLREHSRRSPGYVEGPKEWQTLSGPFYQKAKRSLDVVLAILGLLLTAPIMLIAALAIKLDSPGGIIFRQERCGQGGRNFTMYKFRTMINNAEDLKREMLDLNEVDGPMFKIIHDPRITAFGKILRDTNLDELPQLWNVLKGDMSLVGPRPLSLGEMRYNPKWRDARLSVRPGMSGLWQVKAHTKVYFNNWIINDLEYVKRCSLWLDLEILFMTLKKMVKDPFSRDQK